VSEVAVKEDIYSTVRKKRPVGGLLTAIKRIIGYYPRNGDVPLEVSDEKEPIVIGQPLPHKSFLSYVPMQSYDHEYQQIVTHDGRRGVFLEILPADIEGRKDEYIDEIANKIALALQAIPGEDNPWIVQVYINDEPINALIHEFKQYAETIDKKRGVNPEEENTYRKAWFAILEQHFLMTSHRKGVFTDKKSGLAWRARYRRIRVIIYKNDKNVDPNILNGQTLRMTDALNEAGISAMIRNSEDLHEWLMPWYSGDKEKAYAHMEKVSYPLQDEIDGNLPAGHDIGEMCCRGRFIRADEDMRCWVIGKRLNRFITLEPIRSLPKSAHWNREGSGGGAPFDRLPDGAILMTTVVVQPQDRVEGTIIVTKEKSIGDSEASRITKEECDETLTNMAHGKRLITVFTGIYIDALDEAELEKRTAKTVAAVNAANFDVIEPNADPICLDSYVRGLPMAFRPKDDEQNQKRARKAYEEHTSMLLPFYCRGRGTEHPGWWFNSRDGEPVLMDPLGDDRTKNAHMIMLGSTGAGKTSTLISMLMNTVAIHRPRLFLITSLPTFNLLGQFFEQNGMSVNRVHITSDNLPSLPPFADIPQTVIDQPSGKGFDEKEHTGDDGDQDNPTRKRNIIGEAEVAANLMITGGDPKEEKNYLAQDKALVKEAIILAAETAVKEGRDYCLTEDIATALRMLSLEHERSENEKEILAKYATIIKSKCSGMEGMLFNRKGEAWPDVDVTIIELGELAYKGNEVMLAVAMAGLMAKVNYVVEANQYSGRNTVVVGDEGHILFKNPLIGPLLNTYIAMWRTYGGWFWLATQNLRQLPESAYELLNQPEWWVCLNTDRDEVDQISRFKRLTDEQKLLLEATRKEKGKYIEGVVFSKNILTLIRNVPPAVALALAETEPDEKSHRRELMQKYHCSEVDAAVIYRAAEIDAYRKKHQDKDKDNKEVA